MRPADLLSLESLSGDIRGRQIEPPSAPGLFKDSPSEARGACIPALNNLESDVKLGV